MNIIPRAEADRQHANELAAAKNAIKRYSKYRLHLALDQAGKWDTIWTAIQKSGYEQYWQDCQELASDDALFQGFMASAKALGLKDEDIASILNAAEII